MPQLSFSFFKAAARCLPVAIAAAGVLGSANSVQAARLYASKVVYYNPNGTAMDTDRQDVTKALGDPGLTADSRNGYSDQNFLALGIGGRAVFNFGQNFSGEATLWETTQGYKSSQSAYDEQVDLYYGSFGSSADWSLLANDLSQWTSAGRIKNIDDGAYNTLAGASNTGFSPAGVFNHILLVDRSPQGRNRDGFDVNAIAVNGVENQEIPEPTVVFGLLLLGILGAQRPRPRQTA